MGNSIEVARCPQELHIPFEEIVITTGRRGSPEQPAFDLEPLSLDMTAPTMAAMAFYTAFLDDMNGKLGGGSFNPSWYSVRRKGGNTIDDIRRLWLPSAKRLIAILTEENRFSPSSVDANNLLFGMIVEGACTFRQVEAVFKGYYQQCKDLMEIPGIDAAMVLSKDVAQWIHHPDYNWKWTNRRLEVCD